MHVKRYIIYIHKHIYIYIYIHIADIDGYHQPGTLSEPSCPAVTHLGFRG